MQDIVDDSSCFVHPLSVVVVESLGTRYRAAVPELAVGGLGVYDDRMVGEVDSEDLIGDRVIQIILFLEVFGDGCQLADFGAGDFQILGFVGKFGDAKAICERESK